MSPQSPASSTNSSEFPNFNNHYVQQIQYYSVARPRVGPWTYISNIPPRSAASGQAEMLSLLRQISEDNDSLREEVASLREETGIMKSSLERRLNKVAAKLHRPLDHRLNQLHSSMYDAISEVVIEELKDVISTEISDHLKDLKGNLEEAISEAVSASL